MSRKSEKSEEGEPKVDEGQVAWRKAPLQARFLAHFGQVKRYGIALQRFCVSPHRTRPFNLLSPCDSAGLSGIIQPESGQPVAA
jgi:hypothetical protein